MSAIQPAERKRASGKLLDEVLSPHPQLERWIRTPRELVVEQLRGERLLHRLNCWALHEAPQSPRTSPPFEMSVEEVILHDTQIQLGSCPGYCLCEGRIADLLRRPAPGSRLRGESTRAILGVLTAHEEIVDALRAGRIADELGTVLTHPSRLADNSYVQEAGRELDLALGKLLRALPRASMHWLVVEVSSHGMSARLSLERAVAWQPVLELDEVAPPLIGEEGDELVLTVINDSTLALARIVSAWMDAETHGNLLVGMLPRSSASLIERATSLRCIWVEAPWAGDEGARRLACELAGAELQGVAIWDAAAPRRLQEISAAVVDVLALA